MEEASGVTAMVRLQHHGPLQRSAGLAQPLEAVSVRGGGLRQAASQQQQTGSVADINRLDANELRPAQALTQAHARPSSENAKDAREGRDSHNSKLGACDKIRDPGEKVRVEASDEDDIHFDAHSETPVRGREASDKSISGTHEHTESKQEEQSSGRARAAAAATTTQKAPELEAAFEPKPELEAERRATSVPMTAAACAQNNNTTSSTPKTSSAGSSAALKVAGRAKSPSRSGKTPTSSSREPQVAQSEEKSSDFRREASSCKSLITSPILPAQQQVVSARGSQPQRKISVFSFSGLGQSQLLDTIGKVSQVSSACSATPVGAAVLVPAEGPQIGAAAGGAALGEQLMEVELVGGGAAVAAARDPKSIRSARSDTLGSTGSSRASSCDEPTIVSGPNRAAAGALPSQPAGGQQQQPIQKPGNQSSSSTINNSSSNSSLDSLGAGSGSWQSSSEASQQQQPLTKAQTNKSFSTTNSETSSPAANTSPPSNLSSTVNANSIASARRPPSGLLGPPQQPEANSSILPFESIRAQLKRNSKPNAQVISRHIDNLISQNEAIVDNCNIVSIRSYNSNSAGRPSSMFVEQQEQPASNIRACLPCSGRSNKSWSTSVAPHPRDLLLPAELRPAQAGEQPPLGVRLPSQPERKRSYNLMSSLEPSEQLVGPSHSHRGSYSPNVSSLTGNDNLQRFYEQQQERLRLVNLFNSPQEHTQLEHAIENLSLKRKEEEETRQSDESHITALIKSQQKQSNLILNQDQQQQADELMVAAFMMGRQRRSLAASLEGQQQAAILHHHQQQQQQMIEQQIKWSQHLASLNLNQQASLEMAGGSGASGGFMTGQLAGSSQQLYALREQQALESQLLKDFLSRMMPQQQQLPSSAGKAPGNFCTHGRELLTQSLDNAVPSHRCEACDISFWTRDLLEYHMLTQCVARAKDQLEKQPIAFTFGAQPTSGRPEAHYGQGVARNKPSSGLAAGGLFSPQHLLSKSVSPPRRPAHSTTDAKLARGALLQTGGLDEGASSSILKQQLLTSPATSHQQQQQHRQQFVAAPLPHESLPFKKRKISEPNMRY